jgi:hypothetical protein
LIPWGALSDDRTGLSFVCGAGPCQRSLSRVLVPWDLRPYFTVSDLRLPFSSPPTTRRVTVEVFDPTSTRVGRRLTFGPHYRGLAWIKQKTPLPVVLPLLRICCLRSVFTEPLPSNDRLFSLHYSGFSPHVTLPSP